MRIFFIYPVCPGPVGGLKQTRLTVGLLREFQVNAGLLIDYTNQHPETDDSGLYGLTSPHAPADYHHIEQHLKTDDIIVYPEHHLDRYLRETQRWNCRKAIYNRSGFGALATRPTKRLIRSQIEFVMANSHYTAEMSHYFYGIPRNRIFHLHNWIARPPFEPSPIETKRELAVCYMPRKLPEHIRFIREQVQSREPSVPWHAIDNMPETHVARMLQSTAIFVSTQNREGFGNPAIEAMACGCLVTGYRGTFPFPHPYATNNNGLWAGDRDKRAAVESTVRAIRIARERGTVYQKYIAGGYATAQQYSKEYVIAKINDFLTIAVSGKYEGRTESGSGRFGPIAYLSSLYILARRKRLELNDLIPCFDV